MSFLGSLTIAATAADLAVNIKNAAEKLLTNKPKEKDNQLPISTTGWICPVCGKGLAPTVLACSCINKTEPKIRSKDEIPRRHSIGQSKNPVDADS